MTDLETLRRQRGLSYEALAREIGVSNPTQARKIALGLCWPRPQLLLRIKRWGGWELSLDAMLLQRVTQIERSGEACPG